MSLQSKQGLRKKLADKKYRDAFVASRIAQTIAFQLRVLRQRKGFSQAELANALGTSQNAISRIENPKYGKPSISTLRKIAAYFNVGLIVRFASLSEIADWTTTLTSKSVDIPDFEHDGGFVDRMPPHSQSGTFIPTAKAVGGTAEVLEVSRSAVPDRTRPKLGESNTVIVISSAEAGGPLHA